MVFKPRPLSIGEIHLCAAIASLRKTANVWSAERVPRISLCTPAGRDHSVEGSERSSAW